MSPRRLFTIVTGLVALLIVAFVSTSLLGFGDAAFEDRLHEFGVLGAGIFAGVVALIAGLRSRGRRRISWYCWSAYALLEVMQPWNLVTSPIPARFPSLASVAFLVQLPLGVLGAVTFLRVLNSRLTVTVAFCDGLLLGGGVLMLGLATGYSSFTNFTGGRLGLVIGLISLAQPVADIVILTLIANLAVRVGPKSRPIGLLVGAAIAAIGVADVELTHQVGLGIPEVGSVFATGWITGLLCLGIAALYAVCFRRRPAGSAEVIATSRAGLWVPVVPVALACAAAVGLRASDPQVSKVLIWVMLALIGVTLLRMYLALYMNLSLGKALAHQATHDSLTGLPNRTLLRQRLERALAAIETAHQHVTLMMLDLDGFKEVNDTFGHSAGDQVLVQVARRVVTSVRSLDSVARLGGDEFAVLLDQSPTEHATSLARRLLGSLELPLPLRVTTVSVAASIGIATGSLGDTADDVLRNADLAMYAAKSAGGNGYALYKPTMHKAIAERVRVENALRTAWLTGDLIVHYQPIVDLRDGRMVSVEALARWKHPDGDVIPPSVFIPIAERTGLIIPIGARVLNEACRRLAGWQHDYPGTAELTMSVNVSPRQLYSDDLVDIVGEALRSAGIKPSCLILEVTETAMTDDMDSAIRILSRLKAIGVRMAIDDFGVGASSLARLRRLPVDVVKIDKSLVDHVPDGQVASSVLDAVVGVVNALQLRTVIEGVERADQAGHLRAAGYDLAQGYYFAMPMEAEGIEKALARGRAAGGDVVFPVGTPSEPLAPRMESRKRVIIADDDASVGSTACRIIERGGMRAVLAATIGEAMTELTRPTDSMVIDIGMPDGDGWNLIRHVRDSAEHARMPIVVMTGLLDSAEVLNRAYDLECEYLGKPFAPEALIAKVESARRIVSRRLDDASGYSSNGAPRAVIVAR